MRSNDKIPADEMLLAEAYAAAQRHRLKWVSGSAFYPSSTGAHMRQDTTACCAIGAIALSVSPLLTHRRGAYRVANAELTARGIAPPATPGGDDPSDPVYTGNDDEEWGLWDGDRGESLGWAFRCAMTQDESDPETERLIRERSGK